MAFEHGSAAEGFGSTHAEVYATLHDCGLMILGIRGEGPLSRDDFETTDAWNFLAAPKEAVERVQRLLRRRF